MGLSFGVSGFKPLSGPCCVNSLIIGPNRVRRVPDLGLIWGYEAWRLRDAFRAVHRLGTDSSRFLFSPVETDGITTCYGRSGHDLSAVAQFA